MSHESDPDVTAQPQMGQPELEPPGSLSRRALLLAGGTGGALLASSGLAYAADVPGATRSRTRSAVGAGKTSAGQLRFPRGDRGATTSRSSSPTGPSFPGRWWTA